MPFEMRFSFLDQFLTSYFVEFFVCQVPDMVLVCGSRLRRWKLVNTANSSVNFVGRYSKLTLCYLVCLSEQTQPRVFSRPSLNIIFTRFEL